MDPEPEMLRIAEADVRRVGQYQLRPRQLVRSVAGAGAVSSGDDGALIPLDGPGRDAASAGWDDRAGRRGGAVRQRAPRRMPDNAWIADYRALLRRYAEDDRHDGGAVRRLGAATRRSCWTRRSAVLDETAVIERRQLTVEQLVRSGAVRSSTAPERLGEAAPQACGRNRGAAAAAWRPRDADARWSRRCADGARGGRGGRPCESPGWEARRLLRAARVGTLASAADGQPFASLVTPACAPDLSLLLLLSDLSEHTRHLRAEPRCSVLVAGPPGRQPADRATRHRHRAGRRLG